MFVPLIESVTDDWKIMKNKEIESLYQKPNIVKILPKKK
jgi:hypothetical protein